MLTLFRQSLEKVRNGSKIEARNISPPITNIVSIFWGDIKQGDSSKLRFTVSYFHWALCSFTRIANHQTTGWIHLLQLQFERMKSDSMISSKLSVHEKHLILTMRLSNAVVSPYLPDISAQRWNPSKAFSRTASSCVVSKAVEALSTRSGMKIMGKTIPTERAASKSALMISNTSQSNSEQLSVLNSSLSLLWTRPYNSERGSLKQNITTCQ